MAAGDRQAMRAYNERQVAQLTRLIEITRTELSRPDRQKVMNHITIDAHSRDVVGHIVESGATDPDCFAWQSQLRTYWDRWAPALARRSCVLSAAAPGPADTIHCGCAAPHPLAAPSLTAAYASAMLPSPTATSTWATDRAWSSHRSPTASTSPPRRHAPRCVHPCCMQPCRVLCWCAPAGHVAVAGHGACGSSRHGQDGDHQGPGGAAGPGLLRLQLRARGGGRAGCRVRPRIPRRRPDACRCAGGLPSQMDYHTLGNIFKGLAASGSIGCMDEFNR